jgi:hypothetical protein
MVCWRLWLSGLWLWRGPRRRSHGGAEQRTAALTARLVALLATVVMARLVCALRGHDWARLPTPIRGGWWECRRCSTRVTGRPDERRWRGAGAVTLGTAAVVGMAAGASAARVTHTPFWMAVGSLGGLLVGVLAERRQGPKRSAVCHPTDLGC